MAGTADKAKGRAKQAVGDLTDNAKMKREGKVDEAAGKAKAAAGNAKQKAEKAVDKAKDKVKEKLG